MRGHAITGCEVKLVVSLSACFLVSLQISSNPTDKRRGETYKSRVLQTCDDFPRKGGCDMRVGGCGRCLIREGRVQRFAHGVGGSLLGI